MRIHVKNEHPTTHKTDILIIPFFQDTKTFSPLVRELDSSLSGLIHTVIDDEKFEGKVGQHLLIHTHEKFPTKRICLVGVGEKKSIATEQVRRFAGHSMQVSQFMKVDAISFFVEELYTKELTPELVAQAIIEGASLAGYRFLKYKGKEQKQEAEKAFVHTLTLLDTDTRRGKKVQQGASRGEMLAAAASSVRDLVNEPAVHMKPKTIADAAQKLAKIPGVKVQIFNETAIRKMKMGSFLSVAAGSEEEPYFIHLSYTPKKKSAKKLAICGKGITFDSGGLSLKPAVHMESMKTDMAGAAAILGLFSVIHHLEPTVEVHGVIAATENMPSGKATRPGDIVTAYNGKTIEILNTDAEGRLILADALSWAEKTLQPDYMVDLATLTGAAIVALGQECAAMVGTNSKLLEAYRVASTEAGEPTWELPFITEYKQFLKSTYADIKNISSVPWAGTIMGALFLAEFVEKTPWVHIDIAGPAWVEQQVLSYAPQGASGFGARTLIHLVETLR